MKNWLKGSLLILTILVILPFFACSRGGSASAENITLEFWTMASQVQAEYMQRRMREFERIHPNFKVNEEVLVHADYDRRLPTAIASGTAPDIWTQTYRSVADYVDHLTPINDEIGRAMGYADARAVADSWDPGIISQYTVNGQIYAFPWEANYFAWAINTQHFREAGLNPDTDYPRTWDDVIRLGRILSQTSGGRITRHAKTFPYPRPPIWYLMEFQPIFFQLGGRMFNEAGTESLINSPQAVQSMQHLRQRFDEGVTDRALSTTQDYQVAMQNQETSMGIISVIGWTDRYEVANPEIRGHLRLIPNPSFPGVEPIHGASTWAHAVSARARNRDWAWRLVDYLTNDPSSALIETTTIIPRTGWDQTEGGRNLRDAEMVARVTQNTYPSGTLIHWDQIQLPMQRAMQRILFENADIQTELNRAKAEVDQAIR